MCKNKVISTCPFHQQWAVNFKDVDYYNLLEFFSQRIALTSPLKLSFKPLLMISLLWEIETFRSHTFLFMHSRYPRLALLSLEYLASMALHYQICLKESVGKG